MTIYLHLASLNSMRFAAAAPFRASPRMSIFRFPQTPRLIFVLHTRVSAPLFCEQEPFWRCRDNKRQRTMRSDKTTSK